MALIDSGVPPADIELSAERAGAAPAKRSKSFWDFLFGSDVPDEDRSWYDANLTEGRTALCVRLQEDEQHERVGELLHGHEPLELPSRAGAGTATGAAQTDEQRIPIVKEQLEVGKRQTETRYRVRVYPAERTVEQPVTLRDERVVVEHRPVGEETGPATVDTAPREFEVVERHEEAVAIKTARVTEEVVVHKDVDERTEMVRDTVKETKVEVDKPGTRRP
jgi:stress response protein YsnF